MDPVFQRAIHRNATLETLIEKLAKEKNIDDRNGIYVAGLCRQGSAKESRLDR